jgi:hypothetical protein
MPPVASESLAVFVLVDGLAEVDSWMAELESSAFAVQGRPLLLSPQALLRDRRQQQAYAARNYQIDQFSLPPSELLCSSDLDLADTILPQAASALLPHGQADRPTLRSQVIVRPQEVVMIEIPGSRPGWRI